MDYIFVAINLIASSLLGSLFDKLLARLFPDDKKYPVFAIVLPIILLLVVLIFGSETIYKWVLHPSDGQPSDGFLFFEDFNDGVADSFGYLDNGENLWDVRTENDGDKLFEVNNRSGSGYPRITFGTSNWENYEIKCQIKIVEHGGNTGIVSIFFRSSSNHYSYDFRIQPEYDLISIGYWQGSWRGISTASLHFDDGVWYDIRINLNDDVISIYVNDRKVISAQDATRLQGSAGISVGPGDVVQVDNIQVTEIK